MRACLVSLVLVLGLALFAGCSDGPSQDQCKRLLDHMVSLESESGGGGAVSEEAKKNLEAQKKEMTDYLEKDFMKYCLEELPRPQVECALKARSLEAASKCDKG